jgi:hypothetical protein
LFFFSIRRALESLQFPPSFIEELKAANVALLEEGKATKAEVKRRKGAREGATQGMSHEELVALQQKLLSEAAARSYQAIGQGEGQGEGIEEEEGDEGDGE